MMDADALKRCRRLLVFGGSFDPPHRAHIELPELARRKLNMDAVVYVPAALSPFKQDQPPAPAADRLAMLRLALRDRPRAAVWTDELDRAEHGEPSYTVDTLERLRAALGGDITLRLLIGADQLRAFDQWRDYQRVIKLAEPAVMLRPPDTRASVLDDLPAALDRAAWADRLIELPMMDVSSTGVRRRLAEGERDDAVPAAVAHYIERHGLYRQRDKNS